ncbi:uncharacterized protein BX664DRAFT_303865 [Halteromyces radiatus]|uniref:uncharacterized protein n=1 Tax=Halteromyces radiatus TaxID=101107 RepID=UPI00222030CE|nr:uncharacterized protein BX664DRAFT_303865 [Halteromyces radiatus]KAI8077720.1 hypothetical protein BX664DRAFT_303865 [Halteromyces radiatus]
MPDLDLAAEHGYYENNNNNNDSGIMDDQQSDHSSFMSSPSIITVSGQPPTHFGSTQEFKVAREGWLYKKNSLMQWRPVYAVAKHGNAIKPGALYLYKDDKFANHIHTYDMSEVVEVEPRTQDYRAGIKWEFRLLVKRDDVVLATDDVTARKDWINSLTSIMGKVSLASHTELQSRTVSMEQLNRQLQVTNTSLEQDIAQLKHDLMEAQKRERSLTSEHTARESGLTTELEHVRQTLQEQQRELGIWRSKADELEKQKMSWQAKAQDWQAQAHEWRDRVAVLEDERDQLLDEKELLVEEKEHLLDEKDQLLDEKEQQWVMMNSASSYQNTLRDVKYQLQSLRDQIKDPLLQGHVMDIKTGVSKLVTTFDDSRRGWTELQTDIVKLLESEGDDRVQLLETLQSDLSHLRDATCGDYDKLATLLADIQSSQAVLLETMMKNDTTAMEGAIKIWQEQQQKQSQEMMELQQTWLKETQTKLMDQSKKTGKDEFTRLETHDQQKRILSVLEGQLDTLKNNQERDHEESDRSFKVLGQLFQHVIQQLDDMVVPDISHHLEELVERLATIDQRLHRIQLYRPQNGGDNDDLQKMPMDDEDIRELVLGTRGFMERTLRVLDRFGGSQSGLEETVRRAVKSAFNSHLDVNWKDPQQNEEKLKRYEENARGYIDKAMSGMRGHLEDYTGVMYKMIEDLILHAVQHLENNNNERKDDLQKEQQDRLSTEIDRLKKQKDELETLIKQLGKDNDQVSLELHKKKMELQACQTEYDRLQRQIQQARHDSLAAMARDLEPLVRQINKLKQSVHDEHQEEEESTNRRFKSSRDRTLSSYLNRN